MALIREDGRKKPLSLSQLVSSYMIYSLIFESFEKLNRSRIAQGQNAYVTIHKPSHFRSNKQNA